METYEIQSILLLMLGYKISRFVLQNLHHEFSLFDIENFQYFRVLNTGYEGRFIAETYAIRIELIRFTWRVLRP